MKNLCFSFQPISVIVNDLNQLNKIWMSCSCINPKGMQDYKTFPKWHTFIWSAKTLLNNVFFIFALASPILSKPLESKFVINNNLIVFINATLFIKKSKILASIP